MGRPLGRSAPVGRDPGAGHDRGLVGAVRHHVAVRSGRRGDPGGQPVVLPGHHPGQLRPPRPGGAAEHRPLHRLLSGHGSRRPPVEPLRQLRRPLPQQEELHAGTAQAAGLRDVPPAGGEGRRGDREPSIGVADKLGIGWETLSARNPRLVMVRMPAMGFDGPYRNFVGFGMHLEALGGPASLSGYRDGDPSEKSPVYPMDAAAGTHAALGTLAALRRRARTGRGVLVEVPQVEVILQHCGELLIEAGWRGENPASRQPSRAFAPQGCYPCRGRSTNDDRWLVLTVDSDGRGPVCAAPWASRGWADDARFDPAWRAAGAPRRTRCPPRRVTREHDATELFHRLQAEGVARPVQDQAAQLADPHLSARGFYRENSSIDVRPTLMPDAVAVGRTSPLRWGPLNRLGDANEEVSQIVAWADAEYRALEADGHLSLDYLAPDGTPL